MCEVADRLFNQGKEQGIQQGIQSSVNMLRKLRKSEEEILFLIMEEYELDIESAKKYLWIWIILVYLMIKSNLFNVANSSYVL